MELSGGVITFILKLTKSASFMKITFVLFSYLLFLFFSISKFILFCINGNFKSVCFLYALLLRLRLFA